MWDEKRHVGSSIIIIRNIGIEEHFLFSIIELGDNVKYQNAGGKSKMVDGEFEVR
jgi:hypothetical protein